ncbi:MAG: CHRD domain-containing protein [Pseudomonadota bacterium]
MRSVTLSAILAPLALAALTAPAQAEILTFHATLTGNYGDAPTGSAATGKAKIRVDTDTKRVSVDLDITGITINDLWDKLVAAPIGPVHFHKYATAAGGPSALALPLPFGADYTATPTGLHIAMRDYDYAAGAALLKSTLSFDEFVAAMKSGLVILNVHTDKFNPGEIGGAVVAD